MEGQKQAQPVSELKKPHRAWSIYLLTVAGIPIYVHFTLLLMLIFLAYWEFTQHRQLLGGVVFVISVFASVALHELGHALVAKRYGIKTDDIVLYPIGGVARLRSMGEGFQEFWIAIAGPAVNVVIALGLWITLKAVGVWVPLEQVNDYSQGNVTFWQRLMILNTVLFVFNLIPAFPMDGGRVLRAILARKLPKDKATGIAAKIGQGLAIMFMLLSIGHNPMLMFIGIFVFIAAGQEFAMTRSVALMAGKHIRDAMITHFEVLAHGDSLAKAAEMLLATSQQDFPVLCGSEVLGVLNRSALVQGLATHGREHYVAEVMDREFPRMRPDDELQKVFERIHDPDSKGLPILVFERDRLVGYINNENLMEYLLIAQAKPAH